jgi:LuxR family maltose regulon positive regulatory protein
MVDTYLRSPASVIVITGPPGSGKSTTLRQCLRVESRTSALISLGPMHDDPVLLATAILRAFFGGDPLPEALRWKLTATEPNFSAELIPALKRLVTEDARASVVAVEDVHHINDPQSISILRSLSDAVPAHSRLILQGRGCAPQILTRARVEGRLAEFGAGDLAFDADEAVRLFASHGMADEAALDAWERTGGWAVLLYLAALRCTSVRDSGQSPVAHGSDSYIVDYCRSEILAQVDHGARDFLLETSPLDALTPALCDAVRQRSDSGAMLRYLNENVQLVERLDHEIGPNTRYRYHPILVEGMRAELSLRDPTAAARILSRAADWYAQVGEIDAAVAAAKGAGDITRTAEIVWSDIASSLMLGRPDVLRRRLRGLSRSQIESNTLLMVACGWLALQSSDREGALAWSLRLRKHLGPNILDDARTDSEAAAAAVLIGVLSGFPAGVPFLQAASIGLPPDSVLRASSELTLGVYLSLIHDAEQAEVHLQRARALARALDAPISGAVAQAWQGLLVAVHGDWSRAEELIEAAWRQVQLHSLQELGSSALVVTAYAVVLAHRGDAAASQAIAGARRVTASMGGLLGWFGLAGRYLLARAAAMSGDGATARLLQREADARYTHEFHCTLISTLRDQASDAMAELSDSALHADVLTDAELRVLSYLPSHLSLSRIGGCLHISPNTVKTHVNAIYRKLSVHSRPEAVDRARVLGLLSAPDT